MPIKIDTYMSNVTDADGQINIWQDDWQFIHEIFFHNGVITPAVRDYFNQMLKDNASTLEFENKKIYIIRGHRQIEMDFLKDVCHYAGLIYADKLSYKSEIERAICFSRNEPENLIFHDCDDEDYIEVSNFSDEEIVTVRDRVIYHAGEYSDSVYIGMSEEGKFFVALDGDGIEYDDTFYNTALDLSRSKAVAGVMKAKLRKDIAQEELDYRDETDRDDDVKSYKYLGQSHGDPQDNVEDLLAAMIDEGLPNIKWQDGGLLWSGNVDTKFKKSILPVGGRIDVYFNLGALTDAPHNYITIKPQPGGWVMCRVAGVIHAGEYKKEIREEMLDIRNPDARFYEKGKFLSGNSMSGMEVGNPDSSSMILLLLFIRCTPDGNTPEEVFKNLVLDIEMHTKLYADMVIDCIRRVVQ